MEHFQSRHTYDEKIELLVQYKISLEITIMTYILKDEKKNLPNVSFKVRKFSQVNITVYCQTSDAAKTCVTNGSGNPYLVCMT